MLDLLTDPHAWAALVTLSALEIVLGIDNVVFISILVSRLDPKIADKARKLGLGLALVFRILLLFTLTWLMSLSAPLFSAMGRAFSWHDIILIAGGLFLIAKATHEMHAEIEAAADEEEGVESAAIKAAFGLIILQIIVIDLVFSIDSIVTAIGMAQDIRIMVAAVLIAVTVMFVASGPVARFVAAHPTTKMLALAFLVLIGVALVADGFEVHIPRGYIYFAMAFAGAVEAFNIIALRKRRRRRLIEPQKPV
ncbi:TerC family protein [Rhodoplanes sp. TEM]|uniref:TerC family protein n=1 Tax=Rhodoplanes tepidamans TaxID=200616 RepID=A0ABT5JA08_RHOTP|nr:MULTISPECIES: TerC family protein [Rhodoplanes]MDC7786449.1 TerC family protein [Rhodoplanes tepidamans]MDC7985091.1 TerC family protein [Rhodoplanes sp. TEM]MDQ0357334.1 putative tellurium resistance membrane protein TerC [Rhodoplanes tepidamans]